MLWFYTSYFYTAVLNACIKRALLQEPKTLVTFEMRSFVGLAQKKKLQD